MSYPLAVDDGNHCIANYHYWRQLQADASQARLVNHALAAISTSPSIGNDSNN